MLKLRFDRYITVNVWDFGHYFKTSFVDIIHSTKNKAIKEGTTSINSNYKSSHVAFSW